MKQQIRIVRIFFLLSAALIVGAFYAGFYYSSIRSDSTDLTAEKTTEIVAEKEGDDAKQAEQSANEDAVESMTTLSPDKYYLRQNGEYLSVYKGTSSAVYFDTDIKADELPETLQELSADGIAFDDLADVYEFLENYSS